MLCYFVASKMLLAIYFLRIFYCKPECFHCGITFLQYIILCTYIHWSVRNDALGCITKSFVLVKIWKSLCSMLSYGKGHRNYGKCLIQGMTVIGCHLQTGYKYRMWEKIGWLKFWQIANDKAKWRVIFWQI